MAQKIKLDLKALAKSGLVENFSKQLTAYEKKVRTLVGDFDLKSREARAKGQKQLDKLQSQFNRTRTDIEKRVTDIVQSESKRLNEGVAELVKYLKTVANSEKLKSAVPVKKRATKANSDAATTKKPSTRKGTRKRKSSSGDGASTTA